MEYRNLGRSGLKVSAMSLGCNAFGFRADEPTSVKIIHKAIDSGINLLDTADVYAGGESERIVGNAIRDRRSRVVLATKVHNPMGKGPNDFSSSRQHILDGLNESLRRLGTEYIDLYYLHEWDRQTPLEETLGTLEQLIHCGKVRYVGCSNFAAWQIVKSLGLQERRGWARFIANQPEYSPASRQIEREVLPAGLSEGVGQVVYFPLAGGLFTGKYQRGETAPAGSRAVTQGSVYTNRFLNERNFDLAEGMDQIARTAELPLAHLAIAWAMAKPGISSVIVGATKVEQLESNLGASQVKLSPEVIAAVDHLSADRV